MKGIPLNDLHFFMKRDWKARQELPEGADYILIFMPEGVDQGENLNKKKN